MKRADLQQGMEYLVSGSPDWATDHYTNARVRLVSAGKWDQMQFASRREVTVDGVTYATAGRPNEYGTQVLVMRLDREGKPEQTSGGHPVAVVASLASIRSEWGPAVKMLQEHRARMAAAAERSAHAKAVQADRHAALEAAVSDALGRPLATYGDVFVRSGEQTFSAKVVRELLDALDAAR